MRRVGARGRGDARGGPSRRADRNDTARPAGGTPHRAGVNVEIDCVAMFD